MTTTSEPTKPTAVDAPAASAHDGNDYCSKYLSPAIVEKLQAAAFRSLCLHLQERSDEVQNMELMSLSGFCRNCLAKWMVLGARQLVDQGLIRDDTTSTTIMQQHQALGAFGYEEAAQHVYGMTYADWKKRHQKEPTEEQLERYNASKDLQAQHDKELLATRNEPPNVAAANAPVVAEKAVSSAHPRPPLASNVCCEDVDTVVHLPESAVNTATRSATSSGNHPNHQRRQPHTTTLVGRPFLPPPLPTNLPATLRVGVLTVSDRAFHKDYVTGDLSGPAVIAAIHAVLSNGSSSSTSVEGKKLSVDASYLAIVPDDVKAIQSQLQLWTEKGGDDSKTGDDSSPLHVILTTGGTGFSPRDVTPEATRAILDQECPGLMAFVTTECSLLHQPLASLSRGIVGFRGTTMIANLPGNPKGVSEVVPILLPVLLHAVADLNR